MVTTFSAVVDRAMDSTIRNSMTPPPEPVQESTAMAVLFLHCFQCDCCSKDQHRHDADPVGLVDKVVGLLHGVVGQNFFAVLHHFSGYGNL